MTIINKDQNNVLLKEPILSRYISQRQLLISWPKEKKIEFSLPKSEDLESSLIQIV